MGQYGAGPAAVTISFLRVARVYSVPVCARRGLFSAEGIQPARTENRKMKKKADVVRGPRFVVRGSRWRSRGNATLPQKWALFREAKRRLEHGVPVDVLIRDVTMKLRMMRGGAR